MANKSRPKKCSYLTIILIFVVTLIPMVTAQPLPPSEHILTYEKFIDGNDYAGEYVSIYAKIEEIKRNTNLNDYRIVLMPPSGVKNITENRQVFVSVKNPCDIEIKNQHFFTIDQKIGIPLIEGDSIVVVGMAGKFLGMSREISTGDEGTIILLLTKDEYEDRKKMIYSQASARVISPRIVAVGSYNLTLLDNNVELLNGLVSTLTSTISHTNQNLTPAEIDESQRRIEIIFAILESIRKRLIEPLSTFNQQNFTTSSPQFEPTTIEDIVKNPEIYMGKNVSVKGALDPAISLNADWYLIDEQNYEILLVPKLPFESQRAYLPFEVYRVKGKVTFFNDRLAIMPYEMEKIVSESPSLYEYFRQFWPW
jgi:hypothetical protein